MIQLDNEAVRPTTAGSRSVVFALWLVLALPASCFLAGQCAFHTVGTGVYSEEVWLYRTIFIGFMFPALLLVQNIRSQFFSSDRRIVRSVRSGLRKGEFHIAYQPIVDVLSGRTVGTEALVRWNHPTRGTVSPASFIHILESSGHLHELTRFVLDRAVQDMCRRRPDQSHHLSINVCARDVEDASIVIDLLAFNARLPAKTTLILEFTERVLFADSQAIRQTLGRLKAAGIMLAVDDFGTHCNNIDLLTRFPFDFLKIDRQFVAALDQNDGVIFGNILAIAKHLKINVVAEGVETVSQHNALLKAGVMFGQGYFYGRPFAPAPRPT